VKLTATTEGWWDCHKST